MKLSTLCYLKKDNQTLMLHRVKKDNDIHYNRWNGLGGKFEPEETPEACVIREVHEESGFQIKKPKLCGLMTLPAFKDNEDWYVFIFTATDFSGSMKECEEGNLCWIDDDKLCDLNLWEGDPLFFKWIEEGQFFSASFTYVDGALKENSVSLY